MSNGKCNKCDKCGYLLASSEWFCPKCHHERLIDSATPIESIRQPSVAQYDDDSVEYDAAQKAWSIFVTGWIVLVLISASQFVMLQLQQLRLIALGFSLLLITVFVVREVSIYYYGFRGWRFGRAKASVVLAVIELIGLLLLSVLFGIAASLPN